MVMVDPSVKVYMDSRDDAMKMKCQNMMDCDGDRREYAKARGWGVFTTYALLFHLCSHAPNTTLHHLQIGCSSRRRRLSHAKRITRVSVWSE